nr:glycosyltransferase [Halomicroarcula sp. DFY41]
MIGLIRRYKRVPLGIQAFDHSNVATNMLIAGKPMDTSIHTEVQDAITTTSKPVTTHPKFISDAGLVEYVDKSDVVLILNDQSTVPATAYLAAACRTPVVSAPGGIKEYLITEYDIGIVSDSTSESDIGAAIDEALSDSDEFCWEKFDQDHQWDDYKSTHFEVYTSLIRNT